MADTAELAQAARELVSTWPPLTESQRDDLAVIFAGGGE
jgi:hypothetical protein